LINVRRLLIAAAVAVLLGVSAAGASIALHDRGGSTAPPSARSALGLVDLRRAPAPAFALVDQRGRRVSLAGLRGRVVVLEFMDPRCTDICPVVSGELAGAARRLGNRARDVAFVAINVNQYHESVADVAAFSRAHGLSRLPGWHFLTGRTSTLRRVWKQYGVAVQPSRDGDVIHSSLMYFLDRSGRERWLAMPTRSKSVASGWSDGIAQVAKSLL
jgi:cytochrome oxidase Cu insertion factor (SCO1/SenC/PrrC family)